MLDQLPDEKEMSAPDQQGVAVVVVSNLHLRYLVKPGQGQASAVSKPDGKTKSRKQSQQPARKREELRKLPASPFDFHLFHHHCTGVRVEGNQVRLFAQVPPESKQPQPPEAGFLMRTPSAHSAELLAARLALFYRNTFVVRAQYGWKQNVVDVTRVLSGALADSYRNWVGVEESTLPAVHAAPSPPKPHLEPTAPLMYNSLFGDPAPRKKKTLSVEYCSNFVLVRRSFEEDTPISLD